MKRKLRYLQEQSTKGGPKYLVQIGVGRRCVYLGRYADYDEAATLADASYYHAVVGGFLPRVSVDTLTSEHFNNWEVAKEYVEGGAEKAPAIHPTLAKVLGELRVAKDLRIVTPTPQEQLDALNIRLESLEQAHEKLQAFVTRFLSPKPERFGPALQPRFDETVWPTITPAPPPFRGGEVFCAASISPSQLSAPNITQ